MSNKETHQRATKIIALFVVIELFIVAMGLWKSGMSLEALQSITRFSGRLSLFLFSFIFLSYQKPAFLQAWLSGKYFLVFAVVHGIHLIELLFYITLAKIEIIPYRLAGGMLAYLFIFIMPVLHSSFERGRLSVGRFKVAETVYMYYLWFLFFMTYLPRVQGTLPQAGGSYAEHVALLGWVSLLLGMKVSSVLLISRSGARQR